MFHGTLTVPTNNVKGETRTETFITLKKENGTTKKKKKTSLMK